MRCTFFPPTATPHQMRFGSQQLANEKHSLIRCVRVSTLRDTCKIDNYDENLWHFRSVDNTKYHTRHVDDDDDLNA